MVISFLSDDITLVLTKLMFTLLLSIINIDPKHIIKIIDILIIVGAVAFVVWKYDHMTSTIAEQRNTIAQLETANKICNISLKQLQQNYINDMQNNPNKLKQAYNTITELQNELLSQNNECNFINQLQPNIQYPTTSNPKNDQILNTLDNLF